jgi:hypothetical protein
MPVNVNGLPLHPLIVHAVVVLLPLAALGVAGLALWPRLRSRFWPVVLGVTVLATAAIPLATSTGEGLAHRIGEPRVHAELGDTLIWFAVPLLAVAVGLVWLHRRSIAGAPPNRVGRGAVAVVAVVVALANLVQVYRVGESGARAVWGHGPVVQRTTDGG